MLKHKFRRVYKLVVVEITAVKTWSLDGTRLDIIKKLIV
jgi:hypothetical protein